MDFIGNEFCDDVVERENKCSVCNKKLAFIDTPFGSVPTLSLMEEFFKYLQKELENEKIKLKNYLREELEKISNIKEKEVKKFLEERKNEINSYFLDFEKKTDEYIVKISNKIKSYDNSIEENKKYLELNKENLEKYINQIFLEFKSILETFSSFIKTVITLTNDFKRAKEGYINLILPELSKIIQSINLFNKILPMIESSSQGILFEENKNLLTLDKKFSTKKELRQKKFQFQMLWDEISFFKNDDNKDFKNFFGEKEIQ
ncbi:MAG: hypothetical protein ACTSVV_14635 [Promethearchaeota archaeon]